MKQRHLLAVVFCILPSAAGCGDSWNSLNQMEKNVQNEIADVLTKVQDEATAKFVVTDAAERIKSKWDGVKNRKEKYIKSQFLGTLVDRVDKLKQAEPELTMNQVLEKLKTGEQALKTDQINDIRSKLMLANYEDHSKELTAIWQRIDRELARISNLPEEPPAEGTPQQGPNASKGSFLKQALLIPKEILGRK